ncbi:DUF4124 domain-containing protein [Azonexus sp.]|uniref:DUF4124 domain-containing protein n=1 Tax=Azonexus sp. TaxID=1872668 RepID=UPI0039E2C2B4
MRRLRLPFLAASLLLTGVAADAQTYRWTDANGRTVLSDTPPPGQARQAARVGGKAQAADNLPFATRQAAANFPVTLYTTQDCDPECQSARDLLKARGIPFHEKRIENAADQAALTALIGDVFVPSLQVGRQHQRGFNASLYEQMLDLAGYPKSGK